MLYITLEGIGAFSDSEGSLTAYHMTGIKLDIHHDELAPLSAMLRFIGAGSLSQMATGAHKLTICEPALRRLSAVG